MVHSGAGVGRRLEARLESFSGGGGGVLGSGLQQGALISKALTPLRACLG
jgi:hypothetical protein